MDQTQLEKLKAKLEKEKQELEEELKNVPETVDMGSDTEGQSADEEADEVEEMGTEAGIRQTLKERLSIINHALFKIERGSYGYCEKCKQGIELQILEIDPESRFCRQCKQP